MHTWCRLSIVSVSFRKGRAKTPLVSGVGGVLRDPDPAGLSNSRSHLTRFWAIRSIGLPVSDPVRSLALGVLGADHPSGMSPKRSQLCVAHQGPRLQSGRQQARTAPIVTMRGCSFDQRDT